MHRVKAERITSPSRLTNLPHHPLSTLPLHYVDTVSPTRAHTHIHTQSACYLTSITLFLLVATFRLRTHIGTAMTSHTISMLAHQHTSTSHQSSRHPLMTSLPHQTTTSTLKITTTWPKHVIMPPLATSPPSPTHPPRHVTT